MKAVIGDDVKPNSNRKWPFCSETEIFGVFCAVPQHQEVSHKVESIEQVVRCIYEKHLK